MKVTCFLRSRLAIAFSLLFGVLSSNADEYTQSFTAADGTDDLGDGSVVKGNFVFSPSVQGNRLLLTTNTNNNNSAFHLPAIPDSSTGWTASFDFTIADTTANPPAEGFSFSYGSILFGGNSPRPEEGWPGRPNLLSFEVDIAVNGGDEVGPAIGLNRPATIGSLGDSTHSSSLAFTNGDILPDDGSVSGSAQISWIPGVGASFSTTGLTTNADFVFVPTPGFTADDAHTFAIAARTAGSNAEITIDNLVICVGADDSDGDGLSDAWEQASGLDPNSSAGDNGASGDPDGDGLTNTQEFARGTNPNNPDSDGDGLNDNVETDTGTWVSSSDTGTSPIDTDSDDDGLTDTVETNTGIFVDADDTGTDPTNPNTDGDGLSDFEEVQDISRDPNAADDPDPDTVYQNDFTGVPNGTTDLGDGTVMAGSAVIVNEALQLTTNANSLNAAFHIPARVNSSMGFTVTFDYTIIDNSANNPADGFAFSYGALPFGALSTVAEEGFPGVSPVLSFEMDTWENGGPEIGPAISVDDTPIVANTSAILNDNQTIDGSIYIQVLGDGTSTFTSTGAVTNADFENVVTNFEMLDTHTFAITARTGGANEEVLIDNIELIAGIPDSDGDGLFDPWEIANGLDPLSDQGDDGASGDPDGDGLPNIDEQSSGTDPQNGDSDGDGLSDSAEDGGGVYVSPSQTGTDPANPDTDGDGLSDGVENPDLPFVDASQPGTDPNNPNTDGDMATDLAEIIAGRDPTKPDDPGDSNTYRQDFNGFPDGTMDLADNSTIASTNDQSAAVIDEQLRLTEELVGNTRSSFRIPALRGSSQGFTATFDFTIVDSPGDNPPADGFNFSYGAIPPLTANDASPQGHGAAEEAWPGVDHISFEVDTWMNGDAEVGVNIASEIGGVATNHAFTNGDILADGSTVTGTATISWNPSDGASFTTTGLLNNADFENVQIPGFVGNDDYIFAFGSRTGGAFEDLFIDNLVIVTGSQPLRFDVEPSGDNLVLTWESRAGRVYDVVTSPALDSTIDTWDLLLSDIPTTAPENVETIARPGDATRFYAIIEKEAPALFEEDFESGQGDWITGVTDAFGNTQWEIGLCAGADGSANCAGTNLDGDYGANSDIFLRSPLIDLTGDGIVGASLTMQHIIDTDLAFSPTTPDQGILRVLRASDNTQLGSEIPYSNPTAATENFEGALVDWETFTADLPPEAIGEMIRLEFQFTSNDNGQEWRGWYVDNIEVKLE